MSSDFRERHAACFSCGWSFRLAPMSERMHLWLRIVGLAVILAAEFGPRLWNASSASSSAPVAAAVDGR